MALFLIPPRRPKSNRQQLLHSRNALAQARLVAGGGIAVQPALLDRFVERRYRFSVSLLGRSFVALLDGLAQSAQAGAQAGGVAAIGGRTLRGLTGAFERRKMVSHIASLAFVSTARYSGEYRIPYSTGLSLGWSTAWSSSGRPLTPNPARGTLYLMVVTCLLGMSIPASPVSKHNPVLSFSVVKEIESSKRLNEEKHRD